MDELPLPPRLKMCPKIFDGKTVYVCCICGGVPLSIEEAFNAEMLYVSNKKEMFCKNTEECRKAFDEACALSH